MPYPRSSRSAAAGAPGAGFVCDACRGAVPPVTGGTRHRNHCPHCLSSKHVDLRPGDRRASCRGRMDAIAVWVRHDGEWAAAGAAELNRRREAPRKAISKEVKRFYRRNPGKRRG